MASRIIARKTEGAKIALWLGIMFYIDPAGKLYCFMDKDEDDYDYDKYKLIELTVRTLDEKCEDVWVHRYRKLRLPHSQRKGVQLGVRRFSIKFI